MTRIDAGPVQLNLEQATIVVISRPALRAQEKPRNPGEPYVVDPTIVMGLMQDFLTGGPEGLEDSKNYRPFLEMLKTKRPGFGHLTEDITQIVNDASLEGNTMGKQSSRSEMFKQTLLAEAERILTEPDPAKKP